MHNKTGFHRKGYTLIELLIVVSIISVLASIMVPRVARLTTKAYQAKGKGNLGSMRSAISIYYSENEGQYPLQSFAAGDPYGGGLQMSLTRVLKPRYMSTVPIPFLKDGLTVHNVSCGSFDDTAQFYMSQNPVQDVWIIQATAGPAPGVCVPYGYDNRIGLVYYLNDNYDSSNARIYNW